MLEPKQLVLLVKKFIAPPIFTNAYLLADGKTRQAAAIDPGNGVAEKIVAAAAEMRAKIVFIINTHGHWDHVAGNAALQKLTGAKIMVHKNDGSMLASPSPTTMKLPFSIEPSKAGGYLSDGKKIVLGTTVLECLHTPGHTPGSTCLYAPAEKIVFTGDTLFEGGRGRTDFPGGNDAQIRESLRKIAQLPSETRVLAGHGVETTIAQERKWIEAVQ